MQPSIWQLLIVAALVLILFGRGRISEMMGDVGKGIKSFKKGITDEETDQREREQDRRDIVVNRRQLRIQREDGEVVLESLGKQIRLVRGQRLL